MNGLESDGTINDWKTTAYDWRLSLADLLNNGAERGGKIFYAEATSTPYIEKTLRALAGSSKTGKVSIVAHSNGGLVAKALLNKLGGDEAATLVDKIIMIGAPQSGAPESLGALLVGYNAGIYKYGLSIVSNAVARELAQNSPMAYHLLPSQSYFDGIADDAVNPVASFAGDGYADEISSYGSTIDNSAELEDFILAKSLNSALIDYARIQHASLDSWTPPESIEVSQIAGWGADTVSGIDFYTSPAVSALTSLGPVRAYRPIFTEDGDGVVPVPSALLMSSSTSVKRYWVNLFTYNRDSNTDRKHKDIFEIPQIESFVKNLIKNSTSTLPAYISASQPATITDNKKLTFFLHSPLTLQLTDASGNITGIATDGSMTQDILGSTYGEFGEVKYIIAPAGNYSLTMSGQGSGTFSLDMQESVGGVITASSTIANVPTATSTLASLTVSGGLDTVSALTVDKNGDGINIITITPQLGETVNYEPPAPAPEPEPEPEPAPSSAGGGGGGGSISTTISVTATTTTDALETTSTSSQPSSETTAGTAPQASTPEVATSTDIVQIKKKPLTPAIASNNAREPAPRKEAITNIPPQTASAYDASQQPVLKKLGAMLYNAFHGFWLALKKFF
ncbi:hypothetical protein HY417_01985 [Candidatus Kaiserbacteria bacterium]|nr:hypothetical protein [Candidatus Kaiserbacteria bacterium]